MSTPLKSWIAADAAMDRKALSAMAARMFQELKELTGDGVGVSRQSYGPGEQQAMDYCVGVAEAEVEHGFGPDALSMFGVKDQLGGGNANAGESIQQAQFGQLSHGMRKNIDANAQFAAILDDIQRTGGFESIAQVDHFLSWVYSQSRQ